MVQESLPDAACREIENGSLSIFVRSDHKRDIELRKFSFKKLANQDVPEKSNFNCDRVLKHKPISIELG